MSETPSLKPAPLDDVMLAMDVVDTLRHQEAMVLRELNEDEREKALIERLRQLYASQGLEVTDAILQEGVAALREKRFVYTPEKRGLGTFFAKIYVSRGRWGKPAGLLLAAIIASYTAFYLTIERPEANRMRADTKAIDTLFPAQLEALEGRMAVEIEGAKAKDLAAFHARDARLAIAARDAERARAALGKLEGVLTEAGLRYTLEIVSAEGAQSGIWRVPPTNPQGQNYYLIVEALDPSGRVLELPKRNEETGQIETVTRFGLRVDEATYDKVRNDKLDDGIIQDRLVGTKTPGYLDPDYVYATDGAVLTRW
ncbi:MAG: DUF6384 family protein [Pseudomonadota bacterium]